MIAIPKVLNSQTYTQFEQALVTILGVELEKIQSSKEGLEGFKKFHDDFLKIAEATLTKVYAEKTPFSVKKYLSTAKFPTELDQFIDDILVVNLLLKKAAALADITTPDEWQAGFKEGLAHAEEIKTSAGDISSAKPQISKVIGKHIQQLSPEAIDALAEICVAISITHPEIIPPVIATVTHSEHPTGNPIALETLLEAAGPIATLLLNNDNPASTSVNAAVYYEEQLRDIYKNNPLAEPVIINLVAARLANAPSNYYQIILENEHIDTTTIQITQKTLEQAAEQIASGEPEAAVDSLSLQTPQQYAEELVEQTQEKISESQASELEETLREQNTNNQTPSYVAALVTASEIIEKNFPNTGQEQKLAWLAPVAETVVNQTLDISKATSELSFAGIPAEAATVLAKATAQSHGHPPSSSLFSQNPSLPVENSLNTFLTAIGISESSASQNRLIPQIEKLIKTGHATEVAPLIEKTLQRPTDPEFTTQINAAVNTISDLWAPPTARVANTTSIQLQNLIAVSNPDALKSPQVSSAVSQTSSLIAQNVARPTIEKQITTTLIPAIQNSSAKPVNPELFISTTNNYAASQAHPSAVATQQVKNLLTAAGISTEIIKNPSVQKQLAQIDVLLEKGAPRQEIRNKITQDIIPSIEKLRGQPIPTNLASAVNITIQSLQDNTPASYIAHQTEANLTLAGVPYQVFSQPSIANAFSQLSSASNISTVKNIIDQQILPQIEIQTKQQIPADMRQKITQSAENNFSAPLPVQIIATNLKAAVLATQPPASDNSAYISTVDTQSAKIPGNPNMSLTLPIPQIAYTSTLSTLAPVINKQTSSKAASAAKNQIATILTASGIASTTLNSPEIQNQIQAIGEKIQKGTSNFLIRKDIDKIIEVIQKKQGVLPTAVATSVNVAATNYPSSETLTSTQIYAQQLQNNLSLAGTPKNVFSTPSVSTALIEIESAPNLATANQITQSKLLPAIESQSNTPLPAPFVSAITTPPVQVAPVAVTTTAAILATQNLFNLTSEQVDLLKQYANNPQIASSLPQNITQSFNSIQQTIKQSPQYEDQIALALKSLPTNLDNSTLRNISQIIASSPDNQTAIQRISQIPSVNNLDFATNIYDQVQQKLTTPVSLPQTYLRQITQLTQEAKQLSTDPKEQIQYLSKNLSKLLPISDSTATNLSQFLLTTPINNPKASQVYSLMANLNNPASTVNIEKQLKPVTKIGISNEKVLEIVVKNRFSDTETAKKILLNKYDIAAILSSNPSSTPSVELVRESLLQAGINLQDVGRLSDKDLLRLNASFLRLNPPNVLNNAISNPEIAVSLLTSYPFSTSDTLKRTTERLFQNPKNYDLALRQLLGSTLSQEMKRQQLEQAIILLSQISIKEQQRLAVSGPTPNQHLQNYLDMSLAYLKNTNPKLSTAITQFQTKFSDPNKPFSQTEALRILLILQYQKQFGDLSQISPEFIRYITSSANILGQNRQFLNPKWMASVRLLAKNPDTAIQIEKAIGGKNFQALLSLIGQFNAAVPFIKALVNPDQFIQSKIESALLKQLAKTRLGKILAEKAAATGIKKGLGATLGSLIPIPGVGTAVGWLASDVIGKVVSKTAKFIKENAPVIVAGTIGIGASIVSGSVVIGTGVAVTSFFTGTTLMGGSQASIKAANAIGGFFITLALTVVTIVITPLVITLLTIPIVMAFFLLVINNSAYVVPVSNLTFVNTQPQGSDTTFINVSGCPLSAISSYRVPSYNPQAEAALIALNRRSGSLNLAGHGSTQYWNTLGAACSYGLPQFVACRGPNNTNNVCNLGNNGCPFYGYALDIFPPVSGTLAPVFLPTMNGQNVTWLYDNFRYVNGSDGYTFRYRDTTGKYKLTLTHIQDNPVTTGTLVSGTQIGFLFNQGSNTHLHIELQIDNQYVKPESYLCGGSN